VELRELKPDAKGYLKVVKMAEAKRMREKMPPVTTSPEPKPAMEAVASPPSTN